jgi:hypothetical protein
MATATHIRTAGQAVRPIAQAFAVMSPKPKLMPTHGNKLKRKISAPAVILRMLLPVTCPREGSCSVE